MNLTCVVATTKHTLSMCYDTMYVNTQRTIIPSTVPLCLTTSRDGLRVALGRVNNRVNICDVLRGKTVHARQDFHSSWVRSVCFSSDGTRVASGADNGRVVICDAVSGEQDGRKLVNGHDNKKIRSVCFSPDGKRVASGGEDGRVVMWDISSKDPHEWKQVHALDGGHGGKSVRSVCFSGDGERVASGGNDGRVIIWNALSGQQVHALEGGHDRRPVLSVCFSNDGKRVASGGSDDRVVIWDISNEDRKKWKQLHALEGDFNKSSVYSVCFSNDGTRVASVDCLCRVRIMDAVSGKQVQAIRGRNYYTVRFLGDTNDICCVEFSNGKMYVDEWREIEYRLTRPHGEERADERDAQKPRSESSTSSINMMNADTLTHVFQHLGLKEQQNLALAHKNIRRKLYIKTTNEVVMKKEGHWYIHESNKPLPHIIDKCLRRLRVRVAAADGGAAIPADGADGADGGGAAAHLQRLRL